ncbi:MAG TPA: FGGY family carbohydrate kinase [Polyangiaceae bacterium]|jgi:xylulokinase
MALFLGLDSSTQSLTALVIDTDSGQVVLERSLNFGAELPEFHAPHGFLEHSDPRVRHADPLMWVAALDRLLGQINESGFELARIAGISGAGQQHGSVYLGRKLSALGGWSADSDLQAQVAPLLSRARAPIWMDSSTSAQCAEIASAVGGDTEVVRITGSRAIERFTGAQIRKFMQDEPRAYQATAEIHLVSSFMASLLVGTSASIDFGDGSGMNLLDLARGAWSEPMLAAVAPGLADKLSAAVPSETQVGELAEYFVKRYGFRAHTPVFAFTGDNPSSLVGMGATEPGTAVVSLGTSDTVFAAMREPRTDPRGYGHVFGNPAGGFMCLICFANGSLAREAVATRAGLSWPAFEQAILRESRPGNEQQRMLPYFVPEMTPKVFEPRVELSGSPEFVAWQEPAALARAVVEAQALSMQHHSAFIGEAPRNLRVTGGAAKNRGILQVLADVFGAEICTLSLVRNSSALGGALRAAHAVEKKPWSELYARFAAPNPERLKPSVKPDVYDALRAAFNFA